MSNPYHVLSEKVSGWRTANYPTDGYPAIHEILAWIHNPDGSGFTLRPPQIRALETYWYLRLVEGTPHIFDLYKRVFTQKKDLFDALGIDDEAFKEVNYDDEVLWKRITTDDDFVQRYQLQALRETLNLEYPSYILALAMGAGKTVLIGAIIATEFAMALEYPNGPFVQNALVFAPGLTIIESLRELAEIPYNRILPPRLYKEFAASVKLTFTRDGDPDIPIIPGSTFNIVVTNTEKIRIQKESIRKADLGPLFVSAEKEEEAKAEVANRRLQKIASLPHLAVFSDEAHHTYGQSLETELKKVRKTVDYLHHHSPNLVCVVNTTGTPYYRRQILRDVVVWYGLSEGIRDGILKDVSDNIVAYDFDENIEAYLGRVVEDFFRNYGEVTLPDGTPAKLAMYFPQTDDVEKLRPVIEAKLVELGLSPTIILEHHTKHESKADFDRFRSKDSPHRIALLVDRGVEGWNVPALFACCLARKLKSSNNFVLQASCRCLRQIPGNTKKARIYLSMDNRSILDRQLQETYGETINELNRTTRKTKSAIIRLRKLNIPKLYVKQIIRTVVPKERAAVEVRLQRPAIEYTPTLDEIRYTIAEQESTYSVLQQVGQTVEIESVPQMIDLYAAATELALVYRTDLWAVHGELKRLYPEGELPFAHLPELRRQLEEQLGNYEVTEETVERGLALVKFDDDGFSKDCDLEGNEVYTAEISYPIDREHLLQSWDQWKEKCGEFGFHYTPYNFDSNPELNFFEQMLGQIQLNPDDVEDIYFTGALTDPKKTDFYVEYKGEDGNWHRYTPDFVIRRKDGKTLIVEIKAARFKSTTDEDLVREDRGEAAVSIEGRKAVALRKWQALNPDRIKYQILYSKTDAIDYEQIQKVAGFLKGNDAEQAES